MAPSLGPHPRASHASLRQQVLISPVSHWGTGRQPRCRGKPAHSGPSSLLGCKAFREPGPQCPGVYLCSHFHRWQGTSSLEPPGLEQPQGNQGNEGASETGNQMLRRGGEGAGGASTGCACPWACKEGDGCDTAQADTGWPWKAPRAAFWPTSQATSKNSPGRFWVAWGGRRRKHTPPPATHQMQ